MLIIHSNGNEDLMTEEWETWEQFLLEKVETPQFSLYGQTRVGSFQTMRIRGSCGNKTCFLLIDSGSSHNFIDSRLAK